MAPPARFPEVPANHIVAIQVCELQRPLVCLQYHAVDAENADELQPLIEHRPEAPLGSLDRFFSCFLIRNIPDHARETALAVHQDFAGREVDRERRAVLALCQHFAARADYLAFAGPDIVVHVFLVALAEWLRHQQVHIFTDDLFRSVAEHLLRGPVERLYAPTGIERNDAFGGRSDDCRGVGLRTRQRRL